MMYKVFKRLFDFCSSAALLLALSPLVLVLCLLVRARLGAPVFFKQRRTGRYGRPFTILKFRTMTDARDEQGNLLPDERRVTALGRFLRSTSLDELPELWNILRGDMSVIGPRSLPVEYDAYYTEDECRRFCVRGGLIPPDTLTHNPFISWDEQLSCEADYAMHLSLGRDVRIFLEVFKMLFRRDSTDYGSYVRASLNEERAGREQFVKKKMCVITTIETTMESFVVPAMERFVAEGHEVTLVCKMSETFIQKYSPRFRCVNMSFLSVFGNCFARSISIMCSMRRPTLRSMRPGPPVAAGFPCGYIASGAYSTWGMRDGNGLFSNGWNGRFVGFPRT